MTPENEMATARLNRLPDRAALEQLARALWSHGTLRGAAILVGAGVSRGARLLARDTPPPPLWRDLAADMARELYGNPIGEDKTPPQEIPTDPLRLAEEYRVALGDAALAAFLRRHVKDETWEPGTVHTALLDLPWSDVLTTNYDTLLERAAIESRRGYDVVSRQDDLAHTRSPRIIKLHGSLSDMSGIVFSEEDYRHYPVRCAAFVNVARQVFIENELCLLGFSGDDPNFLQWAGWVRDHLGDGARRIYLVGALDLAPVKRRLLESRNIVPIDISPALLGQPQNRHAEASELFLSYLREAKPSDPNSWQPADLRNYPPSPLDTDNWARDFDDGEKAAESLRNALTVWRNDRSTYPGWLVCPPPQRLWIRQGTTYVRNLSLALKSVDEFDRRNALLELAWRHETGFQPVESWLSQEMEEIVTKEGIGSADPNLISTLANAILRSARTSGNQEIFEARAQRLLTFTPIEEIQAIVAHHRCLFARDRLDYEYVLENLEAIAGDDPMWALRRAAIQCDLDEFDGALRSAREAVRELKKRTARNATSVALRSRFAWARLIARWFHWSDEGALLEETDGYERLDLPNYDPENEFSRLDREISESIRKRHEECETQPDFEPGRFQDNTNSLQFVNSAEITPLHECRCISEIPGVPIHTEHFNVLRNRLTDSLHIISTQNLHWYSALLATRPSHSKGPITIYLNRVSIARLDPGEAEALLTRVENAVIFWEKRLKASPSNKYGTIDALRLFLEVLSRLTLRAPSELAKRYARLAARIAKNNTNHLWLYEPIGHLLERAFKAIPPDERHELSYELLKFPLSTDLGIEINSHLWPNPAEFAYPFISRNTVESSFSAIIAHFISSVENFDKSRPEAALRLLYLHESGQLTPQESMDFTNAVWKGKDPDTTDLPQDLGWHPHAFLIIPQPDHIDVHQRIYKHLFSEDSEAKPISLIAATSGPTPYIQPNEVDAARTFDSTVAWRPAMDDPPSLKDYLTGSIEKDKLWTVSNIIGAVSAPALSKKYINIARAEEVFSFIEDIGLNMALSALPFFYNLQPLTDEKIVDIYRQAFSARTWEAVSSAAEGLDRWLRLQKDGKVADLPDAICAYALTGLERQYEDGLLRLVYAVRRLIEANRFSPSQISRTIWVLNDLLDITDYQHIDPDSRIAISVSLLRAECVQLARQIKESNPKFGVEPPVQAWINIAQTDPLPEVRYAGKDR